MNSISICLSDIPKELMKKGNNGKFYIDLIVADKNVDKYGNDLTVFVSQSKDERAEKKPKTYVGNGKKLGVSAAPKANTQETSDYHSDLSEYVDDLPF